MTAYLFRTRKKILIYFFTHGVAYQIVTRTQTLNKLSHVTPRLTPFSSRIFFVKLLSLLSSLLYGSDDYEEIAEII